MRPLTRAQMRRAAFALTDIGDGVLDIAAAKRWRVPPEEVSWNSPRYKEFAKRKFRLRTREEASMLMSESHRPSWHNGDGE